MKIKLQITALLKSKKVENLFHSKRCINKIMPLSVKLIFIPASCTRRNPKSRPLKR